MITEAQKLRFERVCRDVLLADHEREGIGTLHEKKLHNILKNYFCDDKRCHEIKVYPTSPGEKKPGVRESCYVADVLHDCDIFEIQTGPLYPLREKIEFYLNETDYNITVVHPLAIKKWLTWIDPADGSMSERRRSPGIDHPRDIIPELYALLPYLNNRRLCVLAPLLEVEEFKLRGAKRGRRSTNKYEKIPTALCDILRFSTPADYIDYLPGELPERFTAAEFGRATAYRGMDIYSAIKVFCEVGLLREDGKRGRAAEFIRI